MAKFAVLFVAALAFHATLGAASSNQKSAWIRGMKTQMQENTNDAANALQNAPVDSNQAKRALKSQANEWVRKIQMANYHLERAILNNQAGPGQQVMEQMSVRISEMANSIRQVMNADVSQLKNLLKGKVQELVVEMDKLVEVAQQQMQREQQKHENIWEELEDVMEDMLDATRQLKIRQRLLKENQQNIKSKIQTVSNELVSAVQNIKPNDKETAENLAQQIHELSHELERITHLLRRDAENRLDGEVETSVRQVASKLWEIRAALDQISNTQGRDNVQAWMTEMKNQLKTNVNLIAAQIEKLVLLLKSGNESNQDMSVNNLIRNVIADSLSEARRLQWQLENMNEN